LSLLQQYGVDHTTSYQPTTTVSAFTSSAHSSQMKVSTCIVKVLKYRNRWTLLGASHISKKWLLSSRWLSVHPSFQIE